MNTFVMLSKITPGSLDETDDLKHTHAKVRKLIEERAPEATWIGSYAMMGRYDAIDIFEAPNPQVAATISSIVRVHGHASTETLLAEPLEEFVHKR